jgi:hypothetical protein
MLYKVNPALSAGNHKGSFPSIIPDRKLFRFTQAHEPFKNVYSPILRCNVKNSVSIRPYPSCCLNLTLLNKIEALFLVSL